MNNKQLILIWQLISKIFSLSGQPDCHFPLSKSQFQRVEIPEEKDQVLTAAVKTTWDMLSQLLNHVLVSCQNTRDYYGVIFFSLNEKFPTLSVKKASSSILKVNNFYQNWLHDVYKSGNKMS